VRSILVVCEGNICRSPMAAGLLASSLPGVRVRSAGLGALVGESPHETALALMRERGIEIGAHRAQQVTRAMCLESDVILMMDREQRQRLQDMYPEACGRVFRIGEYVDVDVPDPFRQPPQAFRHALNLLELSIQHWLRRIQRL
jgi:protein-tyrosine phosphatase